MKQRVLADKVAIVTGGARGIGRAICERYSTEGAKVVVADVNYAEAARISKDLRPGSMAAALDVTCENSITEMIEIVAKAYGAPDILVNNAGIFDMSPVLETIQEDQVTRGGRFAEQFKISRDVHERGTVEDAVIIWIRVLARSVLTDELPSQDGNRASAPDHDVLESKVHMVRVD